MHEPRRGDGSAGGLYDVGRRAWPGIEIDRRQFDAWVADRDGAALPERAADLYLACACAMGDGRAAEAFSRAYAGDIERGAARVRRPGGSREDARQTLLRRILVGDGERAPKIESYTGRGSLRGWVRAVAARAAIDLHRQAGPRQHDESAALLDNLVSSADPELEYLRRHYKSEFKRAFETAVSRLPARSRNHLRHAFVEELTIDEVASLYRIHRSTAARRVAAAREALLGGVRDALAESLDIADGEVDSIMRLLDSQMDLSLQRLLGDADV